MLRRIDTSAHLNRWHDRAGPVALLCGGLMLAAMLLPPWPGAPLVLATALLGTTAGAGVPAPLLARALAVPLGFLLVSSAALAVSLQWTGAGLRFAVAGDGLRTAATTGARALAAVSVTLLFALTVPLAQQLALLRRLRVPEPLLDLLLLTYRMVFLLDDSRRRVLRAQGNRLGYRTPRLAFRATVFASQALFHRALDRAVRMERGMAARGYRGQLAVLLPPSRARRRDYLLALVVPGAVACGAVLLRRIA